jgi:hypothetical protein
MTGAKIKQSDTGYEFGEKDQYFLVKKVFRPSESLRAEYIASNEIGPHKNILRLIEASIDDPSNS